MHPLEEEDLPGRSHWKIKNLDPKKRILHYIIYLSLSNVIKICLYNVFFIFDLITLHHRNNITSPSPIIQT